ncbi:MAG TPA: hypothetical protein VGW30_01650 [Gaiellaceae bacterium]|nr:hypothetical protein [Gaiellaceae bacterium]
MPFQSALSVVAPVRDGAAEELDRVLAQMGNGVANGEVIDFGSLSGLHFARIVVVPADTDHRGRPLPANIVYLADLDVSPEEHLAELVRTAGDGVDRVFGHCEGYPGGTPGERERLDWLRSRVAREPATYVNTRGRTQQQISQEAGLREAVSDFLDRRPDLRDRQPRAVRDAIRKFVGREPGLRWALEPADRPGLGARIREWAHLAWVGLLVLVALPFALLAAPVYVVLLRRHEKRDPAPHNRPDEALVLELAALEDHLPMNPFTAVGQVKPGPFRKLTINVILYLLNAVTRHLLKPGDLVGVKTIHFARWLFLNDRRQVLFASNYDGSLESYMDDFIDKISWGLNLVFTNGIGYPRTRWLIKDGCRDELAFKDYLRLHQVRTRVWYSAYGRLSAANVAANEQLRKGLHSDLRGDREQAWVQAL